LKALVAKYSEWQAAIRNQANEPWLSDTKFKMEFMTVGVGKALALQFA
jgi:hypothetical protein